MILEENFFDEVDQD